MNLSRREALKAGLLAGVTTMLPIRLEAAPAGFVPAPVHWIDGQAPAMHSGQTFGVAWPRGTIKRDTALTVLDAGKPVPSQSWITATWPDGSVKWTAHAIPADLLPDVLTVARGRPLSPTQPVAVAENAAAVTIRVGDLAWEIAKSGDAQIRSATQDGRPVLGPVSLVGSSRNEPIHGADMPFTGRVDTVTIEQRGPVRAVVRIDGHHVSGERAWMPFTVRLYAYAGSTGLRIVHSVVFDGSASRDFLSSLGISATVPMRCSTATAQSPWRSASSAAIAASFGSAIST